MRLTNGIYVSHLNISESLRPRVVLEVSSVAWKKHFFSGFSEQLDKEEMGLTIIGRHLSLILRLLSRLRVIVLGLLEEIEVNRFSSDSTWKSSRTHLSVFSGLRRCRSLSRVSSLLLLQELRCLLVSHLEELLLFCSPRKKSSHLDNVISRRFLLVLVRLLPGELFLLSLLLCGFASLERNAMRRF